VAPKPQLRAKSKNIPQSHSSNSQLPKKRNPCPSPKIKSLLIHKKQVENDTPALTSSAAATAVVNSNAYFPKRASAARAEAANRDMLGGSARNHNKRKSSESASAPTPAAVTVKQPTRAASSRKRTKVTHHDDHGYSSSSSLEQPDLSVVDQSILTIHSRVLVNYKGSVYKATIRKRRFKKEKHDFLIHYDGNKKTNVHWIPLDRITKILEVFVETPKKKPRVTVGKKKKGENKRKASVSRQDSPDSLNTPDSAHDSLSDSKVAMLRQTSAEQTHSNDETQSPLNQDTPHKDVKVPAETQNSNELKSAEKSVTSEIEPVTEKSNSESVAIEEDDKKQPTNESSSSQVDVLMSDNADQEPNDLLNQKENAAENEELVNEEIHELDSEVLDSEEDMDMDMDQLELPSLDNDAETANPAEKKELNEATALIANDFNPKDPLLTLALEAEAEISNDEDDDDVVDQQKPADENNSTSNSGQNAAKQQEYQHPLPTTSNFKYPIGSHVYVEYRQIFYSSTVLKARKKRSNIEYFVHYEGYKKSSNRWAKESTLHQVNALTTQRYDEQRFIPADILYESSQPCVDFSMVTRGKKATSESSASAVTRGESPFYDSSSAAHPATASMSQNKSPPQGLRSDASDAALRSLSSGVAFLAGSMVFVEWSGALYLAKMVKKRYSGNRMEYLISYDGFEREHNAWVTTRKIYEVNPQTKRVFKKINSDLLGVAPPGSGSDDSNPTSMKHTRRPPGPKRRETRKKARDDDEDAALSTPSSKSSEMPKTRKNGKHADNQYPPHIYQRTSSRNSSGHAPHSASTSSTTPAADHPLTIEMAGIDPGVEFLPGSTLFAEYKGGLCLAKMLKKRGKSAYMEYYIQYNGLKKKKGESSESEAWVSVGLVYEINPQTKRMFRQLSKK